MSQEKPPQASQVDPHAVIESTPYRGSALGTVLLMVGFALAAVLALVTDAPWWVLVLVVVPFVASSVWFEIQATRRWRNSGE